MDSSSQAVRALLVGAPPTRTTRLGRWAAANRGARTRPSYVETAAVPRRAPDSGSASTGQPLAAANASTAAGSRSAPHPATSSPLGLARTASASSATSPGAGDRTPAGVAVHGAPPARPSVGSPARRASPSTAVGTSGSAKARLRCTGPAGGPVASAQARLASERQ
jgi:hypothetical protein